MRTHRPVFRLAAATAIAALGLSSAAPAFAQGQPPVAGLGSPAAGDPPGRVGRVARLNGTVSFHTADEDQWEPATLNYPVTSGNAFWTQPGATADIEVGRSRIALDQATEFAADRLDDSTLQATVFQGRVYFGIGDLGLGESETLRTPRGTVTFTQPGRYEIVVGDTENPTLVTVDAGAATVVGPGFSLTVEPHQTAQISGGSPFAAVVVAEVPDGFLSAQIARDQPPVASGPSAPPPEVMQMTGYQSVVTTGEWTSNPDYGQVWYPPVDRDWVPYRHGHWSWVAPWGWTWVDDAAWGFAPFHYGRWVEISDRWAWTPGEPGVVVSERPCYSPALVTFVGAAAGVAVGVGIAAAVGWIPLGPREVYRPPYRASESYFRRVNITNVHNITNVTNITNISNERFINRGAATVVPVAAMQRSQALAGVARPIPAAQQAAFRPVNRAPVQPTFATRGVTPEVARNLNLQAQPGAGSRAQASPGPAFGSRAQATVPLRAPGGSGVQQGVWPGPGPAGRAGPPAAPVVVAPTGTVGGPGGGNRPREGAAAPVVSPRGPGVGPVPGQGPQQHIQPQQGAGRPGSAAPVPRPAAIAPPGGGAPRASMPEAPRPAPVPQPVHPAPPQPRAAAPAPVQRVAPPQQMQRAAPPQQMQRPAQPQMQHAAPPPRPAPVARPAPRPALAPRPGPEPRPQPEHKN